MFIREMIGSGFPWLFTVCILPLCLAFPALDTRSSAADPAARPDETIPAISKTIDQPEVLVPKPPPPPPSY